MRLSRCLTALSCLVVLNCLGCSKHSEDPRRHHEKGGKFSYKPPDGWQVTEFPGLKYRISHGPRVNEFAPNINTADEAFSGSLDAYVDASVVTMRKVFKPLDILGRESFRTDAGLASVKLTTENEQQGRMLRQTHFFFAKGNRKYVVTCTALAEGGEELDGLFESSMKTFRLH